MPNNAAALYTAKRLALIILGAVLMAFNINTFVQAGGLIPGGFTGLSLLLQQIFFRFGNTAVPFSIIFFILNAVPALIGFKYIGKMFSLYSCLMIVISGLLTDCMPPMFINFLRIQDTLLSAVFGGLLNAVAISLCLYAGATSGGTDFIAIFISEKYGRDAWNYIFAANCVILTLAAWLFKLDKALYSIIFQFTSTSALTALYKGYQQKTLLIITSKPGEVYELIRDKTNHDATSFTGIGCYKMLERTLLYSVVSAAEAGDLVTQIRRIDAAAFINVLKTEQVNGKFYRRPKD
jgi:uncharacterized membrane-anchored protein YitT (DUF2179 family)